MTSESDDPGDLPRDVRLLWGAGQRSGRRVRPNLNLDQIVRAAIRIADAEGLAVLTMQRLAGQLGAGTMSLYRHVPGKAELVSLMLDTVIGAPPDLDPADWRAALRRWAGGNRDIFRRHPWALAAVADRRVMGPNEMAWAEAALRGVSGLGLEPSAMIDLVILVNSYVRGAAQLDFDQAGDNPNGPTVDAGLLAALNQRDRYPLLTALMTAAGSPDSPPRGADSRFEFGLDCVLAGIEELIRRRPARAARD